MEEDTALKPDLFIVMGTSLDKEVSGALDVVAHFQALEGIRTVYMGRALPTAAVAFDFFLKGEADAWSQWMLDIGRSDGTQGMSLCRRYRGVT